MRRVGFASFKKTYVIYASELRPTSNSYRTPLLCDSTMERQARGVVGAW
jgi:hypothetical protein